MNSKLSHILVVAALIVCASLARCANRISPTGGPRDSIPPVVVLTTPESGQLNFDGRRIFIEFDEYVQIKDQNAEFFTSPLMKLKPTIVNRGKSIRIDIKDTLLENQTYSLNFGNAVQDNNEGNPLSGLSYVFSTGPALDSLIVTGYTADAMRGDSLSKAFVYFFDAALDTIPEYDSMLMLHKPSAVGRSENNGIFIARNLRDMRYKVYAIQDNNGNGTYEAGADKVGFLDTLINPAEMAEIAIWRDVYRHYATADPQVYFRMFGERPRARQNLSGTERPGRHQAILRFSAPFPRIDTLEFEGIPKENVIVEYTTPRRDTMSMWFDMPPEALADTVRGRISYLRTDSLGNLSPASQDLRLVWREPEETREQQRERERREKERDRAIENGEEYTPPKEPNPFRFKVDAGAVVNPEKSIPIEFDLPLTRIDSVRIALTAVPDMGDPRPVPFRLVRDTMNIRKWVIKADWDEEASYSLSVPSGVFVNVAGQTNDSLKADFSIQKRADFATVMANISGKTPESKYIVQVLNGADGTVLKELRGVSTGKYPIYYVTEGDIRIRITEDGNGNGEWDTGSLVQRRQPERVQFYVAPSGDQTVAMQKDREVAAYLDMNRIFAPISMEKIREDLQNAEDVRVVKYLEEKAKREADAKAREGETGGGGLGIGSALSGAKSQIQSTVR